MTPENLQELTQTAQALIASMTPWTQQFRTQIENEARTAGLTDQEVSGIFGVSPQVAQPPPTDVGGARPYTPTAPTTQTPSGGSVDDRYGYTRNPDGTYTITAKSAPKSGG